MESTAENQVHLVGKISGLGKPTELPSGDLVQSLRLVVRRPPRKGTKVSVDTIDIACWSAATRRAVSRLSVGDEVCVEGALRRRFFRSGAGVASRYEVEASLVRRANASSR